MTLHSSAAHSSRIKKSKTPSFKRTSSAPSPYSDLPRRKPISKTSTKPTPSTSTSTSTIKKPSLPTATASSSSLNNATTTTADNILSTSTSTSTSTQHQQFLHALSTTLTLRDVPQALTHIRSHMFCPIPPRNSGLSSTHTSQILNYRARLRPMVTVSHVHALLNSPTAVEREIDQMVRAGVVRRFVVPGRGSGVGEVLVLVGEMERLVREEGTLEGGVGERFVRVLREEPAKMSVGVGVLRGGGGSGSGGIGGSGTITAEDAKALIHAGFLTASQSGWTTTDLFSRPGVGGDGSMRGTLTSLNSISKAASGSLAAVGGDGAVHASGGSGGGARPEFGFGELTIAIPGTGPYIKLVVSAREHLVSLLGRSAHREATKDLLRERWDGGVPGNNDEATARKRDRGEWKGVLPGRTRKWKQFYGLEFEWVLAECVGAGLVEVFETGSVGKAVRAL